jgi:uncharacterized protein (UPF0335 family)
MGGPVDVPGNQLRALVERIEQVDDEINDLAEAKREIYAEAKSNGFDVKVLREVIRLRKQDQKERDEHETLLDLYMSAINGASSVAKAARENGALASLASGRFDGDNISDIARAILEFRNLEERLPDSHLESARPRRWPAHTSAGAFCLFSVIGGPP